METNKRVFGLIMTCNVTLGIVGSCCEAAMGCLL